MVIRNMNRPLKVIKVVLKIHNNGSKNHIFSLDK
jgi:hypothetical protein